MNNYFAKLNIEFEPYNYTSFKGEVYYHYEGSTFTYFNTKDKIKLLQILPKTLIDIGEFLPMIVEISGPQNLPPHIDYGLDASINFYFQPGVAETCFYEKNPNAIEFISHEKQRRLYALDDITLQDKFVAKSYECYLFNNSAIHSVYKQNEETRIFLQFQFEFSYEILLQKVKKMIE